MKIVHFIMGKANPNRSNGVNQVIYAFAKYQSLMGNEVVVVGISKSMYIDYEKVDRDYFEVHAFKSFWDGGFSFLSKVVRECDIVHLHGVWNTYNIIVGRFCEKIRKPYVITSHGGYSENNLRNSNYWIKILYHKLLQKRLYEKSSGIQAFTYEESSYISRYCKSNNIFVLPNGIECSLISTHYNVNEQKDKLTCGFLGRFSKEKNVLGLIKAFSLLPKEILKNFELRLIGPENQYSDFLKKEVKNLNLDEYIVFVGAKYGKDKERELLNMDLYIHPSFTEGFSMAIVEILGYGIPSILTRTSNISYYYNSQAFYMAEPTVFSLSNAILEAYNDRSSWEKKSKAAIKLVEEQLNWEIIVKKLLDEYNKILKRGNI